LLRLAALAAALLIAGTACDSGVGGTGVGGVTTTAGAGATTTAGGGTPSTDSPTTDARGPDVQLFTLPECSVVPGGAVSGADSLTIFVAVRNGGPGRVDRLVPVRIESDTGLRSSSNNAISTGSSFSALQVDLSSSSYNRDHRFVITADPDNQFVERDESNNGLTVTVRLPARPSTASNVSCTSD